MFASKKPSSDFSCRTDDSTDSSGARHSAATSYASRTSASAAAHAGVGSCPGNRVHISISSSFGLKSARLCKPVSVFSTTNMSDLRPLRVVSTTASETSRTHSAWRPSTATRHASAARLAILNDPVASSTMREEPPVGSSTMNASTSDSIAADASRVRASIASHIRAFASLARSTASSALRDALNTRPMPVCATSFGSDRPSNLPDRRSHASTAASRCSRHRRSVSPTNVSATASSSSTDSRSAEADATARATLASSTERAREDPSKSPSSSASSADPRTVVTVVTVELES
mmetsp:Transcript_2993/g.12952  ORF Transcript_2993/g.12952 Transcript_2993/m.12952 type:complete len:291 (-) Transcript_2993:2145-3017(-)